MKIKSGLNDRELNHLTITSLNLFITVGFQKLGLYQVAKDSNIAIENLMRQFPTKHKLAAFAINNLVHVININHNTTPPHFGYDQSIEIDALILAPFFIMQQAEYDERLTLAVKHYSMHLIKHKAFKHNFYIDQVSHTACDIGMRLFRYVLSNKGSRYEH